MNEDKATRYHRLKRQPASWVGLDAALLGGLTWTGWSVTLRDAAESTAATVATTASFRTPCADGRRLRGSSFSAQRDRQPAARVLQRTSSSSAATDCRHESLARLGDRRGEVARYRPAARVLRRVRCLFFHSAVAGLVVDERRSRSLR